VNSHITFTIIHSLRRRTYAGMVTPVRGNSSPTVFSTGKAFIYFFCQQPHNNIAHIQNNRSIISGIFFFLLLFFTSTVQ